MKGSDPHITPLVYALEAITQTAHHRTHTEEKPDVCDQRFTNNNQLLTVHWRIHTGENHSRSMCATDCSVEATS